MHESWLSEIHLGSSRNAGLRSRLRVEVEPERDAARVCPIGEIDLHTVGEVRAQLAELSSTGYSRLILDLRQTTFLDSSGLGLAADFHAAAVSDGFEFVIVAGPPAVQRAFALAGLDYRLPFVEPRSA